MLRFDTLGLGDSEGDWGDGSFTVKVNDVVRACEFMAEQGTPADILVGHSFGGAAVIAAAQAVARRAGGRHDRGADRPRHVEHQLRRGGRPRAVRRQRQWMVGGRTLTLKRAFVEDVREADLHEKIRSLRLPLLILHSPTDNTVGIANASEIFRAARHPRSFVSLEGADHLLTGGAGAPRGRIISAWADPYLDAE